MGAELLDREALVRDRLRYVSDLAGLDLARLALHGPEETLVATEYAQPAIFALAAACLDLFRERAGVTAAFYAGHSLGEYTALYAASSLSWEEAAALVVKRGQAIAEACRANPGTMAAVLGLEDDVVAEVCREASAAAGLVVPANFNGPGQVVISGSIPGVSRASELAKERGGKVSPLKVSGAFHSPLVAAAGEAMAPALAAVEIKPPTGTFVPNVTGQPASEPELIRSLLAEQIASPVRWKETMGLLVEGAADAAIEFGHGRVLAGMLKKVKRDFPVTNVYDGASLEAAVADLR